MSDGEADYDLIVTVRLYGSGSAEDAAQALMYYKSTFEWPGNRAVEEVEILNARPAQAAAT
jgi:hypothetical protein